MGNWCIVIQGTGPHHNRGPADYIGGKSAKEFDADAILERTVSELKQNGQNVEHASFTYGGRDDKTHFGDTQIVT